MGYRLDFELGPDAPATGGGGHQSAVWVYFGVPGSDSFLGGFWSNSESGNDLIREWAAHSVDVTALFDPAAERWVRIDWVDGFDTAHVRRVGVYDTVSGLLVGRPEWPRGAPYSDDEMDAAALPLGEMGQDASDNPGQPGVTQWNPCTQTMQIRGTGTEMRWYFNSGAPNPCGGWSVGQVGF